MNAQTKPSVSFRTVGCRLNQAETASLSASFKEAGYRIVSHGEPCDVCVINSCTITKTAERKSIQYARAAKKENQNTIVILAGCVVEADKEDNLPLPEIDILADQTEKENLPELLKNYIQIPESAHGTSSLPRFTTTRALVKIQDGCDFCCAYCIVPQARGIPRSRPFTKVIDEISRLADNGYVEIVLTGANAGCYEDEDKNLVDILKTLEEIDAVQRLRLSSIESTTVLKETIDFMSTSKKLCRFLHIPLQTGDNSLLKAMGRKYTAEEFEAIINYAADKLPVLGLGTDIITGLPGEDEQAFQNTLSMIKRLPFNNLHIFPYSPRPGTRAESMPNQVPNDLRKQRAKALSELAEEKRADFAQSFIGREVTMLAERIEDDTACGWTGEYLEARISTTDPEPNKLITFVPTAREKDILIYSGI